ncbi:MAG: hypothetical protein ACK56F_31040, partial [bacterium]
SRRLARASSSWARRRSLTSRNAATSRSSSTTALIRTWRRRPSWEVTRYSRGGMRPSVAIAAARSRCQRWR